MGRRCFVLTILSYANLLGLLLLRKLLKRLLQSYLVGYFKVLKLALSRLSNEILSGYRFTITHYGKLFFAILLKALCQRALKYNGMKWILLH